MAQSTSPPAAPPLQGAPPPQSPGSTAPSGSSGAQPPSTSGSQAASGSGSGTQATGRLPATGAEPGLLALTGAGLLMVGFGLRLRLRALGA